MKALGIIRKIDDLGRIVVPKEVRDSQGWKNGQAMEMFMSEEGLVMRGYNQNEERKNAVGILEKALIFVSESKDKKLVAELEEVIDYLSRQ